MQDLLTDVFPISFFGEQEAYTKKDDLLQVDIPRALREYLVRHASRTRTPFKVRQVVQVFRELDKNSWEVLSRGSSFSSWWLSLGGLAVRQIKRFNKNERRSVRNNCQGDSWVRKGRLDSPGVTSTLSSMHVHIRCDTSEL